MSRKYKFAKCLKTLQTEDKSAVYYVHYVGWNKRWDAWVPENRVLKFNKKNVKKQADVKLARNTKQSKLEIATKSTKISKSESISGSTIPILIHHSLC